jgi:hypothetical protein
MVFIKDLNKIQETAFDMFVIISYILIILSFLGLSSNASLILSKIDYYVRFYICLFLIWRFNPFRSYYEFTNLDRKITFTAGLFIFTTSVLSNYLDDIQQYVNVIKQKFNA